MSGAAGDLARFDGRRWHRVPDPGVARPALWVRGPGDVLVAGAGGAIAERAPDGAWRRHATGVDADLVSIDGRGAVAFAVGGGHLLRSLGDRRWDLSSSDRAAYTDVWVDPAGRGYVTGRDLAGGSIEGFVYRVTDAALEMVTHFNSNGPSFDGVGGSGEDDVYAVTPVGCYDHLTRLPHPDPRSRLPGAALVDVWASSPDDVFIVAQDGVWYCRR